MNLDSCIVNSQLWQLNASPKTWCNELSGYLLTVESGLTLSDFIKFPTWRNSPEWLMQDSWMQMPAYFQAYHANVFSVSLSLSPIHGPSQECSCFDASRCRKDTTVEYWRSVWNDAKFHELPKISRHARCASCHGWRKLNMANWRASTITVPVWYILHIQWLQQRCSSVDRSSKTLMCSHQVPDDLCWITLSTLDFQHYKVIVNVYMFTKKCTRYLVCWLGQLTCNNHKIYHVFHFWIFAHP